MSEGWTGRVATRTLLTWAPPIFAASSALFLVQFFFLKFATDVLLLPPLAVGALFAAGRVWDAISDPIVGTWSDRTRTSLGRRRPWMFAGIPVFAVSLWMIWSPPDLPPPALSAWVAVSLFTFYTGFTMYSVPHSSLGAELTTDHHDRSRIFGVQGGAFTIGMLFAFGGIQYVSNAPDPREAAGHVGLGAALVLPWILLIPPVFLRERPDYQGRGAMSSFSAMRDVLRSTHARLLLTVQFVQMAGAGVLGIMAPYLIEYVLQRTDLIGPLPAVYVFFNIASIPLWVRAARRFGKRNVWVAAMVGTGLSFGMLIFIQPDQIALMAVMLVSAGLFGGCGFAVGPSILADVIDADEHVTGERKEGAYTAAWGFAIKAGVALVIVVASVALQVSDFVPNQPQTEGTLRMFRWMTGGFPFVMFLLGAFVFRRFALNEREHARIRAELDERGS
jgi:GPH family glycoside/pentoside/hexuronide:cation symporter